MNQTSIEFDRPSYPPCGPCGHAERRGWFGPDHSGKTHCRDCHRSWTGKTEAHCATCHEHFGSVDPFDAHLELCTADTADVRERLADLSRTSGNPVLALRERASGPVWVRWRPDAHPYGAKS